MKIINNLVTFVFNKTELYPMCSCFTEPKLILVHFELF